MTGDPAIIDWIRQTDARIWQAVIAGLFVAIGWLVNGRQNRRRARRLREERLRDVHRALYAEIGANLANLQSVHEGGERIVARMEEDESYHPFIAREHNSKVFDAIVADIHILPRTSIDAVVAYYAQLEAIAAMTEDLRSEVVRGLPQRRRIALYRDYIAMREQALSFGDYALQMINAFAEGGRARALEVEAALKGRVSS